MLPGFCALAIAFAIGCLVGGSVVAWLVFFYAPAHPDREDDTRL